MKRELCIHHHLGLGDHFDCQGMVRYMLKNFDFSKVYVFSKLSHFDMIKFMYRDDNNIEVINIDQDLNEYDQVNEFLEGNESIHFLRVGFDQYPAGREVQDLSLIHI